MGNLIPILFFIFSGDILYRDGGVCLDFGLNEPCAACAPLRSLGMLRQQLACLIRIQNIAGECLFHANAPNPIYPIAGWVPTSGRVASAA